jgi:hypothetical protein
MPAAALCSHTILLGEQEGRTDTAPLAAGLRFLWSWTPPFLLDAVSGYGYRLGRSIATYVIVILAFAAVYGHLDTALTWQGAVTSSVLSFHGRGLYALAVDPNDRISQVSAFEAMLGLLLEVIFIAAFTQRGIESRWESPMGM